MRYHYILFAGLLLAGCRQSTEQVDHTSADTPTADSSLPTTSLGKETTIDSVAPNKLIIPGTSVGLTMIGHTTAEVYQLLGKPDDGDAAMGKSLSTWYSKQQKGYKTQVFSAMQMGDSETMPRVKSIRVNNPLFETRSHLHAGSTLKEALTLFPALLLVGNYSAGAGKPVRVYDDSEAGIAVEINEQDLCVGINVHQKNEKAFAQYIPFESSFKPLQD